ncbi:MAG: hypothetical protein CL569_05015 [Alphaproteobacteria bacterium]|nr:hypothetical protein [Alphaproteobacteria bacterium]
MSPQSQSPITFPPFQQKLAEKIIEILLTYRAAMNISGTGVGKTYITILVAQLLGLPLFVITTKSAEAQWRAVLDLSGIEYILKRHGEFQRGGKHLEVPDGYLICYDEYKCSGINTKSGRYLSALSARHYVIINSATPITTALHCQTLFAVFGICPFNDFQSRHHEWGMRWIEGYDDTGYWDWQPTEFNRNALKRRLDPYCCGTSFEEANGGNVKNVSAMPVAITHRKQFEAALAQIQRYDARAELTAKAQFVEEAKVKGMAQLAKDELEAGRSVVAFFNYRKSQQDFCAATGAGSIHGAQNLKERAATIERFQSGGPQILAVNYQAGAEGMSLHDLTGVPRTTLLSPTYRARDFVQALGRCHRTGMKSVPKQLLIFAANTSEERVMAKAAQKLRVMETVADSQLFLFDEDEMEKAA